MNNDSVQSNYDALLGLPIVQRLMRQNKNLRKENRSLRNLICSLPEFRCNHASSGAGASAVTASQSSACEDVSRRIKVNIKTEPLSHTLRVPSVDEDDDVVFVTKEPPQNIVYTLEDDASEAEEEEEEASEAEEEEEEEASEAEEAEEEEASEAEEDEEVPLEGEPEEDTKMDVQEVEEEAEEAEEEEEAEDTKMDVQEEEEEEEVFEIDIKGTSYYTTNQQSGKIYAIGEDEDVGDEIGNFVKGVAVFYKKM